MIPSALDVKEILYFPHLHKIIAILLTFVYLYFTFLKNKSTVIPRHDRGEVPFRVNPVGLLRKVLYKSFASNSGDSKPKERYDKEIMK